MDKEFQRLSNDGFAREADIIRVKFVPSEVITEDLRGNERPEKGAEEARVYIRGQTSPVEATDPTVLKELERLVGRSR